MNHKSLSSRISLAVAGIILLFGIIAIFLTYIYATNQLKNEKTKSVESTIFQSSQTLEEALSHSTRLVDAVASNPISIDILESASPSAKQILVADKLFDSLNLGGIYSSIYLIRTDGIAIVSTDKTFVGQNYSFRSYYQEAINGKRYLDVNFGVTSKKLGYYFSSPVIGDNGKIIGVAVIKMNPDYVDVLLQKLRNESMMDLIITDRFGVVISSTDKVRILSSLGQLNNDVRQKIIDEQIYSNLAIPSLQYSEAQEIINNNLTGVNIINFHDNRDNEDELMAVTKINNTPFWIVSEISSQDIYLRAQNVGLIISLTVLVAVICALTAVSLILSRMLSPIKKISRMAAEISGGNFEQSSLVNSDDEIGELSKSIVTMANSLKKRYLELESTVLSQSADAVEKNKSIENNNVALTNLLEDLEISKNDLEKFKLAVDNASDHIIITDPDGIILYANSAVTKITGFDKEDVLGKKAGAKNLWGGLMPPDFYKKLWKTIKIDKNIFTGEVNNHRKNGQEYTAFSSISPVIGTNDEVLYFVGIERDITHEKEVDRMKTEFISLASHQLRTPLSAMRWFTEMLVDGEAGVLTPQQMEYIKNISESNEKMINLVNSLLNISRIESGRIIIDPELINLKSLISSVIKEITQSFDAKKQTVNLKVAPEISNINIDPKLIGEVYKNLLTNANKYSPDGSTISISIYIDGPNIISEVVDNGYGIPEKDIPRVFDKFFRASNILKLSTDGTGLGLYLAKSIVESSGGKIWLESKIDKGTTFRFSMPVAGMKPKKGEVALSI